MTESTLAEALALDPGNLTKFRERELDPQTGFTGRYKSDGFIDAAAGAMDAMHKGRLALHALETSLKQDQGLPPAERAVRLKAQAAKRRSEIAAKVEEVIPALRQKLADLEASTLPLQPKTPTALAAEQELRSAIRSTIGKMSKSQLGDLLNGKDRAIATALLNAHPLTSGLTKSQQDLLRASYQRQHHAAETATITSYAGVVAMLERADIEFARQTKRMVEDRVALSVETARQQQTAATAE